MIDYIKLDVSSALTSLKHHRLLDWLVVVNRNTGEVMHSLKAEYKNLVFLNRGSFCELSGSLHKYYNDGRQNWNDYTYSMLAETIIELYDKFDLNPYLVQIHNVEFGVNLRVDFEPKPFLRKRVISYKGSSPTRSESIEGKGFFIEFKFDRYSLKIYDKGLHFDRSENILRVEIKTRRMAHIKSSGIAFLVDLLDIEKLQSLLPHLTSAAEGLLIWEDLGKLTLSSADKAKIKEGYNPVLWKTLKPDPKTFSKGSRDSEYTKQYKHYQRKLKRFNGLLAMHDLNRTNKYLEKTVIDKWEDLLILDIATKVKITSFLGQFDTQCTHQKRVKFTGCNDTPNNCDVGEIHTLSKRGISPYTVEKALVDNSRSELQKTDLTDELILRDAVKKVVYECYDGIFTEPEIMSDHTIYELISEVYQITQIKIAKEEFIGLVRYLFPYDPKCPF